MPTESRGVWASGGPYERYVGRWSRLVARDFVDWLSVPGGREWLDVGCGTGALTRTILERAAPRSVTGVDPSAGFLAEARRTIGDPRAEFRIGDARALPVADQAVAAAVAGLAINFVPDMAGAVREMLRVTHPGGTVAGYVWDYAEGMQMMRLFWDAAVALDPAAAGQDEGRRFPVCRPEPLAALFSGAGARSVGVRAIEVATVFADFQDYWEPFLGGQGPAPAYCMSLAQDRRAALEERLRISLPFRADGSIHLSARAWAVRATA